MHRLVAFALCLNPNNYNVIDHIDRNRPNNMLNNFRWCSSSENNKNIPMRLDNTSESKELGNIYMVGRLIIIMIVVRLSQLKYMVTKPKL